MFRILLGVLLAQSVAAGLMWLNQDNLHTVVGWVSTVIPIIAVALVTAFWFGALNRQAIQSKVSALREEFAHERQRIKIDAERAKAKILKKSQQQITRETKRTHAKANFKVGAAITAAIGFGVFMMFTQFVTAGLIIVASAGSLMGGYMLRLKREQKSPSPLPNTQADRIDVEEVTATHRELPPASAPQRARIIEAVPAKRSWRNQKSTRQGGK